MTCNMKKIKKRIYEIISKAEEGDLVSKIFDWSIMILIALSIISIILESFVSIYDKYHSVFQIFEVITVVVFTIEYLLRIWTADLLFPESKHPRLKYVFSFMAIIDLLAILPFYLPFISADLRFLRMMRLFRLFRLLRVFKLGRYFEALQIIVKVIKTSGPQLIMSVVICFFVMLFSAIIMYTVENPVQPEQFPNVISSLWWAICTLTTVGYGDVYPITHVGRLFASLISLVGIGIIAIPTGIIAAGFNQAITRDKEEEVNKTSQGRDAIEEMDHDDLLNLQARIIKKLSDDGYFQKQR
ncbi:voltage-gated potassium channel [Aristaeella lactis]|uniref:Voltage-gated potassium channel n=1 Tax=Aristaeella lactis TaxID=3046383 RepID=A0AC61PLH8_9FIRM|nr:voltage-gated potassium channel [Aristaeella lactis]